MSVCLRPPFLDNHWSDLIETCQVYCWGSEYVPFQGLILIAQMVPKKTYPHCYSKSTGGGLWIALQYSMLVFLIFKIVSLTHFIVFVRLTYLVNLAYSHPLKSSLEENRES